MFAQCAAEEAHPEYSLRTKIDLAALIGAAMMVGCTKLWVLQGYCGGAVEAATSILQLSSNHDNSIRAPTILLVSCQTYYKLSNPFA